MAPRSNVEVIGLDDVERLLKKLPERVEKKVNKSATLASARVIARRQRAETPQETGDLKRAIKAKAVKSRVPGRAVALAGVFGKEASLARLIEFGTGTAGPRKSTFDIKPKRPGGLLAFISKFRRVFARSVQHPGIAPNPFVTRAADEAKNEAGQRFRDIALKGIVREANKLSPGSAKL